MVTLLKNRNFALLWLAQVVSGIGDVLYNVGIMVTIFERTGSALQTAGVLVANGLPQFVLGPVAGAIVDRAPRQRVLVLMDVVRALLVGLLLVIARGGDFNVWTVYVILASLSAATTFYKPAQQSIIPALVPRAQLVRANSFIVSSNQATVALGYAVGGVLIVWLGFRVLVAIDLASFLVAALFSLFIRPPAEEQIRHTISDMASLPNAILDGISYLRRHELSRTLVLMELLEHIPHGVWSAALMLVFVNEALGGTPNDWGYQTAAYKGGELLGAALALLLAGQLARRPGWFIITNATLFGLLTVGYALSPTPLIAILMAFTFGPTFALRDVAQDSLLQAAVDNQVLGRVYALRSTLVSMTFMLSGLGLAYLADQVAVRWIYVGAGILYLGTALYALLSPTLRASHIAQEEKPQTTLPSPGG